MKKIICKILAIMLGFSIVVITPAPVSVKADTGDFATFSIIAVSQSVFQYGPGKAITFTISNPNYEENVKFQIFNSKNKLIRTFLDDGFFSSIMSVSWDGKDTAKKYVADGTYKFKATAGKSYKLYYFKVKKKLLASDSSANKYGFLKMYGISVKIPSTWLVNYTYGSSYGRCIYIYSPLTNGKEAQIMFSYKNYSAMDFTDTFIKEETLKASDDRVQGYYSGKVTGTSTKTVGGIASTVKNYEYNSYNLSGRIGMNSFEAAVTDTFTLRSKMMINIKLACRVGYTGCASIYKTVMDSVKFSDVNPNISQEFEGMDMQTEGTVVSAPFSLPLPTGFFAMSYEDDWTGETYQSLAYGNPIYQDSRFQAGFQESDTSEESFETMVSAQKDELRGLPETTPKLEDVTIDGVACKKVSVSYLNERFQWTEIQEYYMFERNATVYTFYVTIIAEKGQYDKQKIAEFIATKDAMIASLKIAK